MAGQSTDHRLAYVFGSFWTHRQMIIQMTKRDVIGRYRGSMMGLLWSLITPLIMLTVYTFVFGFVFKARWDTGSGDRLQYAMALFAGLIVFGIFAECLNKAPTLIVSNVNFVKKVVFPVEVLPWITLLSSLFHATVSFAILIVLNGFFSSSVHWTTLAIPIVLVPFLLMTLGLTWFLAALGVYLRDVSQTVGILTSALMFASPIFFPITALPEEYRGIFALNPITIGVEQVRAVLLWGRWPDWREWSGFLGFAIFVAWLGLAWFQKARRGFADVI